MTSDDPVKSFWRTDSLEEHHSSARHRERHRCGDRCTRRAGALLRVVKGRQRTVGRNEVDAEVVGAKSERPLQALWGLGV